MKKWCGVKKSTKTNRYRVIIPLSTEFIDDDMMINNDNVSGKILTKWFEDIELAKVACMEFNTLQDKYNK